jgi:hypothetical protein
MNGRQVIYKDGNNEKFNYYILANKSEVCIDKNSLSYKVDTDFDKTFGIVHNNIKANFDLVIVQKTKQGEFKGYILCDHLDIDLL